jgi:hypothetical protein
MAHGVMLPHCGAAAGAFAGGVGLQSPGADPGVYGTTALAPSIARRARIAAPTVFPKAIPAVFPGPLGTLDKLFASPASYEA